MLARTLAALHTTRHPCLLFARVTRFVYLFCTSCVLGFPPYNVFPG